MMLTGTRSGLEASTSKSAAPQFTRPTASRLRTQRATICAASSAASPVTRLEGQGKSLTLTPQTSAQTSTSASSMSLEQAKSFLQGELATIFNTGRLDTARYADDFKFQDPTFKQNSIRGFQQNLTLLRSLFSIKFIVHNIKVQEPAEVTSRWTMELKPKLVPWQPKIVVTGESIYTVDQISGKIQSQRDVWDSISDNNYLSLEGLAYILGSLANPQQTPNLEMPKYTVLKRAAEYEVRQYSRYIVAETAMPRSSGAAAGTGFNELAGFIFGGNDRRARMEMTAPVISNAGQASEQNPTMQFVMEERLGSSAEDLPNPNDARVTRRAEEGGTVASISFSGIPLDFEVTGAERRLRAALLLDGLNPQPGYKLARYNDPFTLPFLRRNEVLIKLDEFELP
ncbi:hypothetical protein WJX73_001332 [Symbiochloris irregularis]|uniref:SOUL heme-binding protein n=1 Tax=Symbiochloris irregularis TaxID=706552 RepID=A0AAW1PMG4_9CHLO